MLPKFCFRIESLETGQYFLIVTIWKHCTVPRTQFGNIALFLRTRFGSIALFPWPNLGSIASLSCPKLGSVATFWRKRSTRLVLFFEFLTHLESDFKNFIHHSWIRKRTSSKYQKLVNWFRVPLNATVTLEKTQREWHCTYLSCSLQPFLSNWWLESWQTLITLIQTSIWTWVWFGLRLETEAWNWHFEQKLKI